MTHFVNFKYPALVIKKIIRSSISDLVCESSRKKFEAFKYSLIIILDEIFGLYKNSKTAHLIITWNTLSKLDKLFQVIIKCAVFEFLYKPKISSKIIIKEYLNASNFFLDNSQTKYLNALLDKISKKIRISNAWIWIN